MNLSLILVHTTVTEIGFSVTERKQILKVVVCLLRIDICGYRAGNILIGVEFGRSKETVDRYEIRSVNEAFYYVKGKIRDGRPVAEVILSD